MFENWIIDWAKLSELFIAFLFGLLTAYLVNLWSINREKEKSVKEISVDCRYALSVAEKIFLSNPDTYLEFITIRAVNERPRPVTLVDAGLLLENKHTFTQLKSYAGKRPLPIKLEDGDFVVVYFDLPEVVKALKEYNTSVTKAYFRDSLGEEYSTPVPKDIKDKLDKFMMKI